MNYLDRNEYNFDPSPEVIQAYHNFDPKTLGFYTRIYDTGKKSIFSQYLSEPYGLDEQQVLLGYGGEYLLKQTVHYFLTRPDGNNRILIPKFSWWYYQSVAAEVDGETHLYRLYEEGDTFKYDFEDLQRALAEVKPRILLLASPNNPTGNCLTPDELDSLLAKVPDDVVVYVDEAYASYINEDITYVSKLVNKYPNVIIARTLSKFYGLPGLRMGFAFVSKGMEKFAKFSNVYLGYNRISEDIAIAALKSEAYYRHVARQMDESRKMYETTLSPLEGFKVYRSAANFILVKYPIALKAQLEAAFKDQHYKVKFMNDPGVDSHMRITLGRPEQNIQVAQTICRIASSQNV